MGKLPHQKQKQKQNHQFSDTKSELSSSLFSDSKLWDCGSTLYDSFELNSFKCQLNSAIIVDSNININSDSNSNSNKYIHSTRRTLSMSHLPETRVLQLQPLAPVQVVVPAKKNNFNITRSFQKFIRSIFKSSNNNKSTTNSSSISFQVAEKYSNEHVYVVYEKSSGPVLTTIPEEVPEFEINGGAIPPPEISSSLMRSTSERITSTTAVG